MTSLGAASTGAVLCLAFLRRWYPNRGVLPAIVTAAMLSGGLWTCGLWLHETIFALPVPAGAIPDPDTDMLPWVIAFAVIWFALCAGAAGLFVALGYDILKGTKR